MAHAIGLRGLAKMPASLGCAMGLQVCKRFGWVFRLPPFNGLRGSQGRVTIRAWGSLKSQRTPPPIFAANNKDKAA